MAQKNYDENGVFLAKKTLYSGDRVGLSYNGLLCQAGAESVYVYAGFGETWNNKYFLPMSKENEMFKAEINILDGKTCEVCFKDSADNWDNNSGENYVFNISKKHVQRKPSVKVKRQK
ncbi:MAG TPA: carbohydrate-binding protein [Ruminiclostridium sp.]|nr:carbohydrate-binding protein [Ruminiclostridium sp.]